MRGIVVGVNEAAEAREALDWALAEASSRGVPLTAVLAWTPDRFFKGTDTGAEVERRRDIVYQILDAASHRIGSTVPLQAVVVNGSAREALINAATDADMLVLGRRRLNKLGRLMLGSVSAEVVERSPVPVTVVRHAGDVSALAHSGKSPHFPLPYSSVHPSAIHHASAERSVQQSVEHSADAVHPSTATSLSDAAHLADTAHLADAASPGGTGDAGQAGPVLPRDVIGGKPRIVVGVDSSQASIAALQHAAEVALRTGCVLEVIYAWQITALAPLPGSWGWAPPVDDYQNLAKQTLNEAVEASGIDLPDGQLVKTIAHNSASTALIDASAHAARVIVGARGLGGFDRLLLGSVSRQVVEYAHCPVTIVH